MIFAPVVSVPMNRKAKPYRCHSQGIIEHLLKRPIKHSENRGGNL